MASYLIQPEGYISRKWLLKKVQFAIVGCQDKAIRPEDLPLGTQGYPRRKTQTRPAAQTGRRNGQGGPDQNRWQQSPGGQTPGCWPSYPLSVLK